VRHEPLRDAEVTVAACNQEGGGAKLVTPRHIATQKHRRRQNNAGTCSDGESSSGLALSRSDAASLCAFVRSHCATAR
jgi:hypothetical protein